MSAILATGIAGRVDPQGRTTGGMAIRLGAIGITLGFVGLFLIVPLVSIFHEALSAGWREYGAALISKNSLHAIWLTLGVAAVAVPMNTVFGIAAAWAITKFEFRGKALLVTLIDLPFSVSPVISGMVFLLLFGAQGWMGPWLAGHGIRIVFAYPGMVLATMFVTAPFVARELIPLMEEQGTLEEQAAISLGASGWQTFRYVTLPNIKWGLLYGVILCNARAMGEFGAVAVVTQNWPGLTNTMTREIDDLYGPSHRIAAAFALASLLAMLGLATMGIKALLEWRIRAEAARAGD